jgi:hypothetical protein
MECTQTGLGITDPTVGEEIENGSGDLVAPMGAGGDIGSIKIPYAQDQSIWMILSHIGTAETIFRGMSLNYTNNSKYKILALQLECVVKEDTTLEQLQKLNDFRTSEKWTDAQLKKLTFDGENDKFAEPGESVADAECYLNDSYGNGVTKEMYDLFTPSMMKIAFVGPDEKGYDVTYDFIGDAYGTSSSEGIDLYTWSENELPALLPEPKDFVVTITSDKTDYFYAYVYGMKASDFKEYAVAAKEKEFNQDSQEINSDFYAKNADGQRLRLSYSEEKERMSIDLFQK